MIKNEKDCLCVIIFQPGFVQVTSPYGNEIHHKEKVAHGQFAFTATEAGSYIACFSLDGDQGGKKVTVGIDWKTGIAAKDWDTVARKEKIEVTSGDSTIFFSFYMLMISLMHLFSLSAYVLTLS